MVRMPSRKSGSGQKALPEVHQLSGGPHGDPGVVGSPPGGPGVVGRPSRRSGCGREALP